MSKVVKLIIKLFDNLITLNNIDIAIFYDKNKKIWFSLRDIFNALGYKNIKAEIKRLDINEKHITNYINLRDNLIINKNIKIRTHLHPQLKFVDEAGIYIILNKSTKPIAKEFQDELFSNILPKLREDGQYKFNSNDRKKLKKLKHKLTLIRKEQLIKRLTTKKYSKYNISGKGFIYILKVKIIKDGVEKICYKIGYTTDLNKRLDSYKTGHPDIELVYQENVNVNKKQLEKCVLSLNILKRLSNKSEIICNSSLEDIIKEIKRCKTFINNKYDNLKI